jgi:hypothetical protein
MLRIQPPAINPAKRIIYGCASFTTLHCIRRVKLRLPSFLHLSLNTVKSPLKGYQALRVPRPATVAGRAVSFLPDQAHRRGRPKYSFHRLADTSRLHIS